MIKKTIMISALLIFNKVYAHQVELNFSYEEPTLNHLLGQVDVQSANGKYLFKNLEERKEAPIKPISIEKISQLGIGYAKASGSNISDNIKRDLEITNLGLEAELFIPHSNFFITGSINQTKIDTSIALKTPFNTFVHNQTNKTNGYAMELGYIAIENLKFGLGVSQGNVDPFQVYDYGFTPVYKNAMLADDETLKTLHTTYVTKLGKHDFSLQAKYYMGDEKTYYLNTDFYLDPSFKIGASFFDSTAHDYDHIFSIHSQKFFSSFFGAGFRYTKTEDDHSYAINSAFRF
jgi:hypothetical protein